MKLNFILGLCTIFIFTFTIVNSQNKPKSHAAHFFRMYSKASSKWRNINYHQKTESKEKPTAYNAPPAHYSTPEECARPCSSSEGPKTCYYHWTFELYKTLSGACELCQPSMNNSFLTSDCQCILADGVEVSGIMTVNRMYHGPAVQVCVGDYVIIDALNEIAGNEIVIHWHGLFQNGFQYYDGVPFLTQCPITESTTFRYQFAAENSGTFFWHAHSGLHKGDGLEGPFIIRKPEELDANKDLFDDDSPDNLITLTDWFHESAADHFPGTSSVNVGQSPDNILINGKGRFTNTAGQQTTTPLAVFEVKPGRSQRFRMINACSLTCPVEVTIAEHNLTIIAVDGVDVEPKEVTTIVSLSAERIDFILDADRPPGTFWIQARGMGGCAARNLQQFAVLKYSNSNYDAPPVQRPAFTPGLPRGVVFNPLNVVCDGTRPDVVCVTDLESAGPIHPRILEKKADVQLYMPYFLPRYNNTDLYTPGTYKRFVVPVQNVQTSATVDGISFVTPSSPFISQLDDIPPGVICDRDNLPAHCANTSVCFCAHVKHVPLNSVVELLFDDKGTGLSHPWHLHGYGFHVMAVGHSSRLNITEANKQDALALTRKAYSTRNDRPATKDTIAVPANGYAIVRFIADNPGWWFVHCHFLPHVYNGMAFVLRVGEQDDLPPTPTGFPKCGNFTPAPQSFIPKSRKQIKEENRKKRQ